MNRQVRLEGAEGGEEEENFDLSNFNPDDMLTNKQANEFASKINFQTPPDEDFLYNNTLWPENSKLYGHGYDIISTAVSHDGTLIASGGKSQSEKHSKLFLWDALKNNLIKKFDGHVLTIVKIEFSYDDKYILSVSRDRSICIFEKIGNEKDFKLVQIEKETHARIIWSCSWAKDSEIFLTGSRDNYLKVWKKNSLIKNNLNSENNLNNENSESKLFVEAFAYEFKEAITSVNLIDEKIKEFYVGFVGLENGEIYAVSILLDNKNEKSNFVEFKVLEKFPEFISHGMAVKRIKSFKDGEIVKVATCSDDYTVRIFEITVAYFEKLLGN